MPTELSRRTVLAAPLGAVALLGLPARLLGNAKETPGWPSFPSQDPARVRETVLYAHSDSDKVRRLVSASPALANAAIDWGFGDWESAIGAASHMGRRDIAEILLDHGARPDLFTHAMLGNLAAVRAAVEARPGIQRTTGPHGITLLAHAKAGGEFAEPVLEYLEALGDADPSQQSVPLSLPAAAYLGFYAWSAEPGDRLEVEERRDLLSLRRGEGFGRTLFHLGGHEFHPTGAPSVRVRFQVEGERAVALTVLDPGPVVTARRVEA